MGIQAISNATIVVANNNSGIDKSGNQTETNAASTNGEVATIDVVQLSAASKGTSTSDNDIYYDVRDTNKDGIVSLQEALQYALTHPGEEIKNRGTIDAGTQQAVIQYNQQGSVRVNTNTIPGLINISV
jgi:hypothetical protein